MARFSAAALCGAMAAMVLGVAPTLAQQIPPLPNPSPIRQTVDANGVDLATGYFNLSFSGQAAVGQAGAGGLSYALVFNKAGAQGWTSSLVGQVSALSGGGQKVSLGAGAETFSLAGGAYVSDQGTGSTLTSAGNLFTYTLRDGTRVVLDKGLDNGLLATASNSEVSSITSPTGEVQTFNYYFGTYCQPIPGGCQNITLARLQSVTDNLGYQLRLKYAFDGNPDAAHLLAFYTVSSVTGLNMATDYCAPTAATCVYSHAWPHVDFVSTTYGGMAPDSLTDANVHMTHIGYDASGQVTSIQRPSGVTVTMGYDSSGRVRTASNGVGTWTYDYADNGDMRTTTITDPNGNHRMVGSQISTALVQSDTDGLNRTTSYQYDPTYGRLTRVTLPESDYTQYAYDARGNVTDVTQVAKPGTGLSNLVTHYDYDATCTAPAKCNQPNFVLDPKGARTDFGYDSATGEVLTVTGPAVTYGQPQTRYHYGPLHARYKDSSGVIVQDPTTVARLTTVSVCRTSASCLNGPDETRTAIAYANAADGSNNLLPTSVSAGPGDGAPIATTTTSYTDIGNVFSVDGPLSGSADLTVYIYDPVRQVIGVIGPDPDGASGPLKNRAIKTDYNADGQPLLVQQGTTDGYSDQAWQAFIGLDQYGSAYDSVGRLVTSTRTSSSTLQQVTQQAYDNANRPTCTALRMNPATFGSLPASACTPSTPEGPDGPDRITLNGYDAADELTSVTSGYQTSPPNTAITETVTYIDDGLPRILTDGEGHQSLYERDGFDRLKRIDYPNPMTGQPNLGDYVEYTLDANGNVTQLRQRDGTTIGFSYDALNRVTHKGGPIADVDYGYDLVGNLLSAQFSSGGPGAAYTYDALGRKKTETTAQGTVYSDYDAAGRRIQLTWPDGFNVQYDYDVVGELLDVREYNQAGHAEDFAYNNLGQRVSRSSYGAASTVTYGYNSALWLGSLGISLPSAPAYSQSWTYGQNRAGQLTTRTSANDAYSFVGQANGPTAYSPDALNRYSSVGGQGLAYDDRKNLTNDGVQTYGYDPENRLTSASGPRGATGLTYDALGRLNVLTQPSGSQALLWDGDRVLAFEQNGSIVRRFLPGQATDETLLIYEGAQSNRRVLFTDERGSVVLSSLLLTDNRVQTYDEYGQPGVNNDTPVGYTGQLSLPTARLFNYKARAYHPGLGRFLQTDPAGYGAGLNLYAYVGDDPINLVDPTGLGGPATTVTGIEFGACRHGGFYPHCFDGFQWGSIDYHVTQDLFGNLLGAAVSIATSDSQDNSSNCPNAAAVAVPAAGPIGAGSAVGGGAAAEAVAAGTGWGIAIAAILSIPGDSVRSNTRDNEQWVIRGGIATPDQLMAGAGPLRAPYSGFGISVNTAPRMTAIELALAANRPNTVISVSTVSALKEAGFGVVPTPFLNSPTHATIFTPKPLDPATAKKISDAFFIKDMKNPAKCP